MVLGHESVVKILGYFLKLVLLATFEEVHQLESGGNGAEVLGGLELVLENSNYLLRGSMG